MFHWVIFIVVGCYVYVFVYLSSHENFIQAETSGGKFFNSSPMTCVNVIRQSVSRI